MSWSSTTAAVAPESQVGFSACRSNLTRPVVPSSAGRPDQNVATPGP